MGIKNASNKPADGVRKDNITRKTSKDAAEPSPKAAYAAEMAKHQQNLETVMRSSNATPMRGFGGVGYSCYFCSLSFLDPGHLKVHTLEYHQDFKFSSKARRPLLDCYSVKLDITSLTCNICAQPIEDLKKLFDHLQIDHAQPMHTDVKNYILPFRFGSGPLKCVLCEMEFSAFKVAVEHMNIHFRNFICEVCDAGFVTKASWRNHRFTHELGDYPCKQCPKVFNSASKLRNHTQSVHFKAGRNKCPYCEEKFNWLIAKNNHMAREHGVVLPPVKCNACDKMFKNIQHLTVHKKTYHLMERRYKCAVCELEYSTNSSLRKHMAKHLAILDFKCQICQRAFGQKTSLIKHMRVHSGRK